ncbi:type II toxin-antitoxin system RelE/ParE family toxin [Alicyclobacillaceae bacterium I2511]|nr:type II toxin-antitoxin system RelE/ParE family toxin [Alicyclobacillaceae bacterium I2511]
MKTLYELKVRKQVTKFLDKLDSPTRKRLVNAIYELADDPFYGNIRKMECYTGMYRKSVGDFRILYEIVKNELIVDVIKLKPRGDVYRDI